MQPAACQAIGNIPGTIGIALLFTIIHHHMVLTL